MPICLSTLASAVIRPSRVQEVSIIMVVGPRGAREGPLLLPFPPLGAATFSVRARTLATRLLSLAVHVRSPITKAKAPFSSLTGASATPRNTKSSVATTIIIVVVSLFPMVPFSPETVDTCRLDTSVARPSPI